MQPTHPLYFHVWKMISLIRYDIWKNSCLYYKLMKILVNKLNSNIWQKLNFKINFTHFPWTIEHPLSFKLNFICNLWIQFRLIISTILRVKYPSLSILQILWPKYFLSLAACLALCDVTSCIQEQKSNDQGKCGVLRGKRLRNTFSKKSFEI